jgi:hypothetical protein
MSHSRKIGRIDFVSDFEFASRFGVREGQMLAEACRFVVAAVLAVSVPILVWKIAETVDHWRADRRH